MRSSDLPRRLGLDSWRAALVAGLLLATASPAAGEPDPGRREYERAMKLSAAGRHEAALAEFENAYRLSKRASQLYNIALAHESIGGEAHLRLAAAHYRRYLAEERAPRRKAQAEAALAALAIKLPPVDAPGSPQDVSSAMAPIVPPAPEAATAPVASPQQSLKSPPNRPGAPADSLSDRPPRSPVTALFRAGMGIAVVGLATAVVGGLLLGIGTGTYNTAGHTPTLSDWRSGRAMGRTEFFLGATLVGVGGAALLAGLVMIALPRPSAGGAAIRLIPTGLGLVAEGVFY